MVEHVADDPALRLFEWRRMHVGDEITVPASLRFQALGLANSWGTARHKASLGVYRPKFISEMRGDVCAIIRVA